MHHAIVLSEWSRTFHDRDAIAGCARSAVAALAQLKIMNGNAEGNANPLASATRAETAALIYNLLVHVEFLNVTKQLIAAARIRAEGCDGYAQAACRGPFFVPFLTERGGGGHVH